jgi:hypothetical protein
MNTDRGFVQSIDVGRGGLVTVTVVLGDLTTAVYVISDLDGDPERFNERLSKLALLRDAMNRAEPVEIDHDAGPAGEEIERAERITRDALGVESNLDAVVGLVAGVLVHTQAGLSPDHGSHDYAEVLLLTSTGEQGRFRLDLQLEEASTAAAQLDLLRDAFVNGELVRVIVSAADDQDSSWILEVATGGNVTADGGDDGATVVSGFIESLSLIPLPGQGGLPVSLASVVVTTAPEFVGAGGTVDPAAFTPSTLTFVVVEGSRTYTLIKAGLEDKLRMRLSATPLQGGFQKGVPTHGQDGGTVAPVNTVALGDTAAPGDTADPVADTFLCTAVQLLASLASASRPVWICIDRSLLDRGPDAIACTPGTPTSDLTPQTLRDLGIPYTALWRGHGCFNHGVYRFQVQAPAGIDICLDGKSLCLYPTGTPGIQSAYACVDGDHELTVEVESWTCGATFDIDVYRIR